MQEWEEEITGYADYFEREDLPRQRETLNSNFIGLAKNVLGVFEKQLNCAALPGKSISRHDPRCTSDGSGNGNVPK